MNATIDKIKAETLALIERQAQELGISIDEYLRRLVPGHEKELALKAEIPNNITSEPNKTTATEMEIERQKSILWIRSHREDYGGLYVALVGDQLIGTGRRYGDALKIAREKGYPNAFIGDVLPIDYEGFSGGWERAIRLNSPI